MSKVDVLPFQRGQTCYGRAATVATSGTFSTDGDALVGQQYTMRDDQHGTGNLITLRIVRNSAGFALLPKRLVRLNVFGREADGYVRLPEEQGFAVDELLPSAGVADDDLFYVVIEGLAVVLTSLSNYGADVAVRTQLNSQTAVTSGATTAGRLDARALVAATADATAGQRNRTEQDGVFGMAVSSALTSLTNGDVLVDVYNRIHA
jgi:hypothetical protein